MKRIAIIGAGNVGKVMGVALKQKGYPLVAAFCRTALSRGTAEQVLQCPVYEDMAQTAAKGDIVFITTPDQVIEEVCTKIAAAGGFCPGQVVLHTSGAHSSMILAAAQEQGAHILSFHPLQTFPGLEVGLQSLPGTFFTVEGDEAGLNPATELISAMGGKIISIPTEMKPLYHAAACIACNYLVSLFDMALKMYEMMDIPREKAMEALSPLIQGTMRNVASLGPQQALTGPIARGDAATIASHLEKMEQHCPELISNYQGLGHYTVKLALLKGTLGEAGANEINKLLGGQEK